MKESKYRKGFRQVPKRQFEEYLSAIGWTTCHDFWVGMEMYRFFRQSNDSTIAYTVPSYSTPSKKYYIKE